jgi:hypothetical protein
VTRNGQQMLWIRIGSLQWYCSLLSHNMEEQREEWKRDMDELQRRKSNLQFDCTCWYHWRAMQINYQKALHRGTSDLARCDAPIKKRSSSVSLDLPRAQRLEAHRKIWEEFDFERSALIHAQTAAKMKRDEAKSHCDSFQQSKETLARVSFRCVSLG